MMTDGDVSAHERAEDVDGSLDGHLAGHAAILELLRAHDDVVPRSPIARVFGRSPLTAETHETALTLAARLSSSSRNTLYARALTLKAQSPTKDR